ncbi:hypothetical protein BpHYR1_004065 [Brachionus plicatilis]|uniref:Uncharacterized protein n=1 Tax=Brachionus plicatilis TaxID=10195 RepID=A0A3M7QYJ4_BRAPC|nr:hypothetical protein BpHYR1_004065 [Brachionus plicatilis]
MDGRATKLGSSGSLGPRLAFKKQALDPLLMSECSEPLTCSFESFMKLAYTLFIIFRSSGAIGPHLFKQ